MKVKKGDEYKNLILQPFFYILSWNTKEDRYG
jgi:hypothetical protein